MSLTNTTDESANTPLAEKNGQPAPGGSDSGKEDFRSILAGLDRKTAIVVVTAALAVTFQNYGSYGSVLDKCIVGIGWVADRIGWVDLQPTLSHWAAGQLGGLFWWALVAIATYFLMPALVIRFVLKERLRDYGLKIPGALASLYLYLGMLAIVLPLVILISAEEHFKQTYPFYRLYEEEKPGLGFWCWEILYAGQFCALEFFFRGFMVLGTRHRFGPNAIFFMVVPYCMIHFNGKPFPEAMASIIAGLALGLMSYKTRSVWLGAALHVTVAWTMDLAQLIRGGFLP